MSQARPRSTSGNSRRAAFTVVPGGQPSSAEPALYYSIDILNADTAALKLAFDKLKADAIAASDFQAELGSAPGSTTHPLYQAATAKVNHLESALEWFTNAFLSRPARTWDDVALTTEMFRAFDSQTCGNSDLLEATKKHLFEAVRSLAAAA